MRFPRLTIGALVLPLVAGTTMVAQPAQAAPRSIAPVRVTTAVAFDLSRPMRDLPVVRGPIGPMTFESRDDEGPFVRPRSGFDAAVQRTMGTDLSIFAPILTFEGLKNGQNPSLVVPPDPNGAVGPNNYVELVNTVWADFDKTGHMLHGPSTLGSLWAGFSVSDCAGNAGDPVVLYDRKDDRWLLSQFTSNGPNYYNCVAISQTSDPGGAYYRYAFPSGQFFPDYPKYGEFGNSFILTSRDFGPNNAYGISVYGLERMKMVAGNPNARMVHFFLDSAKVPLYTIGDGLLPADVDGKRQPALTESAPVVGTQNSLAGYGAPSDALNVYDLTVPWTNPSSATLTGPTVLAVDAFNSTFPCGTGRQCIPQPGTSTKIDFLGYRQRPLHRLAFRVFNGYETMVTNQSVQATPGVAGVRWYEIRRVGGTYSVYQQGTYAPADGVNRWMGSIAMDQKGDMGLGFSVSDGTSTFPGIRFTGRHKNDPLGMMTLREGTIINGGGSQLTAANRWGDYTSMWVDPVDDCTFWYTNEYYSANAVLSWQTRIGTFKYKTCK